MKSDIVYVFDGIHLFEWVGLLLATGQPKRLTLF